MQLGRTPVASPHGESVPGTGEGQLDPSGLEVLEWHSGLTFMGSGPFTRPQTEFQARKEPCSRAAFGRPFWAIDPRVDKFGTLDWPNREEIERLLLSVR